MALDMRKKSGDLDYAANNMKLYAVRLWLPEYRDADRTSVVLNIFEGKFIKHVFLALTFFSSVSFFYSITFSSIIFRSLRPRVLHQQLLEEVPVPHRQGQSVEREGDDEMEGPQLSRGLHS